MTATLTTAVSVHYGLGPSMELGAWLPVVLAGGGFLDGAIHE